MPRFFIHSDPQDLAANTVVIRGADAHHIARALRLAVGDPITVCDDGGTVYDCRLTRIRDEEAVCEILARRAGTGESPLAIRLFMAYPKGDKFETVLQKAVELGAARITPFESERCIKRPPAEKQARIAERHAKIAEAAAKQCGRSVIPTVDTPLSFADALRAATGADLPLFCYEGKGTQSLRAVLEAHPAPRTVSVLIGAEGGFSEAEAKAATDAGCIAVGLGERILRCETAPAYVLSALSYAYELPHG